VTATFGPYKATVVAIHDGDTIDVDVQLAKVGRQKADADLGFNVHRAPAGIVLERQAVRLYGCNADELSTAGGQAALAYLQTLVHVGDVVTLVSHGWDKYRGRVDGSITLPDGRDLSAAMIAAGHAVAWDGKGVKPTT
jgi:endonuclease YncB( thermonuclease family)